jgi:hypothetical protein
MTITIDIHYYRTDIRRWLILPMFWNQCDSITAGSWLQSAVIGGLLLPVRELVVIVVLHKKNS